MPIRADRVGMDIAQRRVACQAFADIGIAEIAGHRKAALEAAAQAQWRAARSRRLALAKLEVHDDAIDAIPRHGGLRLRLSRGHRNGCRPRRRPRRTCSI